jgi:hypothetical protein
MVFSVGAQSAAAEDGGVDPGVIPADASASSFAADEIATAATTTMPSSGYDYYATYQFSSLPGYNQISAMRLVAQQADTAYYIDTNNNGTAEYTGTLAAGGMYEVNVPTGTHLLTSKPATVVQYDDYACDWEDVYLAPTTEWGTDYWYAGIKGYGQYYDYLLFTAMKDGTVVTVDLNNDGIADQTFNINKGGVATYSAYEVYGGPSVGKDTRAGAHITSNYPIQTHAFASMTALFGAAYTVLPTPALGKNYYVPFIRTVTPASWDVSDRILIVASENNTTITIDENNDGIAEATATLNKGQTMEYPSADKSTPFLSGTHVTSDKPAGVVYSSPRGLQHWDGGAVQLVPENASLKEYWNTVSWNTLQWVRAPYTLATMGWPGEPDVILYAFQDNTVVNIDANNDGTPEKTYTLNKGNSATYKVTKAGEHIYSDKAFSAVQTWYTTAAAEIEQMGYRTNQPPVPCTGPDQIVECASADGTPVILDGSCSSDPDNDPLTYSWSWSGGNASGVSPTITLPLGVTSITLIVSDGKADSEPVSYTVTVRDATPPVTQILTTTGQSGNNGWYKSDVQITLSSTDSCTGVKEVHYSISGTETVVPGSPASVNIAAEGTSSLSYFAQDNAGNTETAGAPVVIKIDKTDPTITASAAPAADENGWNKTDVTVTFTCGDAVSGVASCTEPVAVSTEGTGQTISGTAIDNAGRSANASLTLNIDKTAPAITILGITDGASYPLCSPPTPSYTVTDNLSGIVAENGVLTPSGNANGAGLYTYTVTATDAAGNTATQSATYRLVYDFGGFLPPVTLEKPFKKGSTIPVKFTLTDGCGAAATSTIATLTLQYVSGDTSLEEPIDAASTVPDQGNLFRYSGSDGIYIYNLATNALNVGTYVATVTTDDGVTRTVNIQIKQ